MSCAGLWWGFVADRIVGDPRRGHPVAAFGSAAQALQDRMYADSRPRGVAYLALLVAGATVPAVALDRLLRPRPVTYAVATAAASWAVLGGTTLHREARELSRLLAADALPEARVRLTHLVGRDTSGLGPDEVARATVESVAENTSDAVVAPLFWGSLLGIPGLVAYRAINTLDAMVGHRTPRLERFGWASARTDDVVNWLPARLSALLAAAAAPAVGGDPRAALRAMARDAGRHPSPNAGQVEAAFAGALGVRLGGANSYAGRVEDRGTLGDGRPVAVGDIRRAVRLGSCVQVGALGVALATRALIVRGRRRGVGR